ncbi:FAD-dependent oxidoreductase [Nocardia sp. NEAU-G5]|uniref:FAD-dependent oxidoreductase n=1 Tax=Nocardia albiluteola TaxID=2842303 RepID=A0ABS6AQS2_9NOCA|nr:FAD-dependent oxidoreductase [Nocardia albiluteola]MBU3060367.1 FAD-dependent oxidoreductase [Nocardia albiluteola]
MGGSVLISGAGVAGSTLAYWLARHGFTVTVVERAAGQRSSGNPVDVKGHAVAVAEDMGVMPQLRAAATAVRRLVFLDTAGRERAGVSLSAFQGSAGDREVEISRADLAAILLAAARDNAEIRWGDAITGLEQAGDAVEVTFERGTPAHFDLVIGADGSHSAVRRLAFGPDSAFVRHMGMYVATLPVDHTLAGEDAVAMVSSPGRAFSVHPAHGIPLAAFFFRQRTVPDFDYRDLEQHKRLLAAAYAGKLGVYEEFLDRAAAAEDLYFDSVSRVSLPHWSIGRIGVVGDAASSLSLFGDGSTLAIIGAHTLAAELASTPGDISGALARYERRHRAVVRPKLRGFALARMLLVPNNRANITARNLAVRAMDTVL